MLKRMIVKRLMYRLAVAAMLVVPVSAMAQTSSINAFSPYSMYGIGELQTPGVVAQRSMGPKLDTDLHHHCHTTIA